MIIFKTVVYFDFIPDNMTAVLNKVPILIFQNEHTNLINIRNDKSGHRFKVTCQPTALTN